MADFGFVHQGRVYTPNGTTGISAADTDARNRAIEQAELSAWAAKPDHAVAYFRFPWDDYARVWRTAFYPLLTDATCTTWLGTTLGRITSARVYTNNLGARLVSLHVVGTNGADYHGRGSWDGGTFIRLHRSRSQGRRHA